MIPSEQALRRLAIGASSFCHELMAATPGRPRWRWRIAAWPCCGSADRSAPCAGPLFGQRVGDALAAGLSFDEIVASLLALAPTLGIERTVALAPDMALALDYDLDAALERLDG